MPNQIYTIYYLRYPFRFGSYLAILRSLTIKPLVTQLYRHSQLSHHTYAHRSVKANNDDYRYVLSTFF
jgi:hypothetical protein